MSCRRREGGKRAESLCCYIEERREGKLSVIELGSLIREMEAVENFILPHLNTALLTFSSLLRIM